VLAGVDRSYIGDHPDLLAQIRQQRGTAPVELALRPVAERSTPASLQARLASAHDAIARLKAENHELRDRLAVKLGDAARSRRPLKRRADRAVSPSRSECGGSA
jgi:hypothetical protein